MFLFILYLFSWRKRLLPIKDKYVYFSKLTVGNTVLRILVVPGKESFNGFLLVLVPIQLQFN